MNANRKAYLVSQAQPLACCSDDRKCPIANESVPKIILNYTIIFLLNCIEHFGNFKT